MSFGNPLGFLALAGIPIVLLIHLLQVRSRLVRVSTLFLLDSRAFEREGGRKLEQLRSSPLLWLQLLAVLGATWLLVEPRWLREDTTLSVVLVVDGSASMSAYRDAMDGALGTYLPELEDSAERVEWTVLGSDPATPTLYSGDDRAGALAAALEWRSYLGVHDMGGAVAVASALAGPRGVVLVVSDHVPDVPSGVEVLAVGTPLDNVGVVSVSIDDDGRWRAIVKSSGESPQTRTWWVEVDGVATASSSIELSPGQVQFVSGEIPAGAERLEIVLEADRLPLDDRLPFVVPQPKTLAVYVAPALRDDDFVNGFLETIAPFALVDVATADLAIGARGPLASIVFSDPRTGYLDGPIVVASDELVDGLDFRGLVATNAAPHAVGDEDRVLVWQDGLPILALRETGRERVLFVGFTLEKSNAARIPAFVLALHRFADRVRDDKRALARDNVETRQLLAVAAGVSERAPEEPGFFEVERDGETLFVGAAHFADVRESDLSLAETSEPNGDRVRDTVILNSLPDPLSSLWLLLLMAVATWAWVLQEKGA